MLSHLYPDEMCSQFIFARDVQWISSSQTSVTIIINKQRPSVLWAVLLLCRTRGCSPPSTYTIAGHVFTRPNKDIRGRWSCFIHRPEHFTQIL